MAMAPKTSSKMNICAMVTIWDDSFLLAVYIFDKVRLQLTGWSGVEVNIEKERFKVVSVRVVVWQTTSKNSTQVRAARAARLLLLIQPITSRVVANPVVVS